MCFCLRGEYPCAKPYYARATEGVELSAYMCVYVWVIDWCGHKDVEIMLVVFSCIFPSYGVFQSFKQDKVYVLWCNYMQNYLLQTLSNIYSG